MRHVRDISRAARDADARAFRGAGHGFRRPERERRRGRGVQHARRVPPGPRGRLRGHRARDARGGSGGARDAVRLLLFGDETRFLGDAYDDAFCFASALASQHPRLPRARYKKLSVRSNASYPGSGDALAAQRETRPVSAALFLRCRERTTREKRFSRRADPSTTNRHDEGPRGADLRSSACLRRRAHEGRRKNCPLEAPRPVEARGSTFLGFWVFGFLASSSPRRFGFSPPERRSALRRRTFVERRGFARAASRARRGSRVNVARRTSGRRASRPAGFAELLPVALRLGLRDGRVRLRGADHGRGGGGVSAPRAPRAGVPPAPRRSRRGASSGVSAPRAPRARAARRAAARARRAAPSPAPPLGSSAPASVPSARASRAGSPAPSASAAAAAPWPAPERRRTGCAREAPAAGQRGLAVRLAVVLLVLRRRRLAVLLVLLLRRRLLVLLLVVLLVLLGGGWP